MVFVSWITALGLLIAGIILYVIGKYAQIEPTINKVLYIIGLILIIIGIILLVVALLFLVI